MLKPMTAWEAAKIVSQTVLAASFGYSYGC